jgi:hypothetical protein
MGRYFGEHAHRQRPADAGRRDHNPELLDKDGQRQTSV